MSSTVRDALAALAALLASGEPDVADRVTSAHDDPDAYLRTHADQLDERGIDEPIPNLAGARLSDDGTTLAVLDIESDCYPLVLLPNSRRRELMDLATATGFTAGVLGALTR